MSKDFDELSRGMDQVTIGLKFIYGILSDVKDHFEKHDTMSRLEYEAIGIKHRGHYESRAKNRKG